MISEELYQLLMVQDLVENHFLLCGCLPDDVRAVLRDVCNLVQVHLDEMGEGGNSD